MLIVKRPQNLDKTFWILNNPMQLPGKGLI